MNALQMALINAGVAKPEQAVVETEETKLAHELTVLEKKLMDRVPPPDVSTQLLMTGYKVGYMQTVRGDRPLRERLDTLQRAKQWYERELSQTV